MSISGLSEKMQYSRIFTTKDTENSSFTDEIEECFGLFTFNNKNLKTPPVPEPFKYKKSLVLENRLKHKKTINQRIKNKEIENQLLIEKIKSKELEIQNGASEESRNLAQITQKTKAGLKIYQEKLAILQKKQTKLLERQSKSKYLELIYLENFRLSQENTEKKAKIDLLVKSAIPEKNSSGLGEDLKRLEKSQIESLQENFELKQQLSFLRESNYSKSCSILSPKSKGKLLGIYYEVFKINALSKLSQKSELINLKDLSEPPINSFATAPLQLASMIKKELSELKAFASDHYANFCANICITQ